MNYIKKLFPIIAIVFVVSIFFWQFFLKGLLPIPSDALVGLYHPFRDLYSQQFPRGIPFKNFLITDPIRQLYPWKELSISLFKQFQLPLWNPYSFSGYPLLANFQSAVFYPLNMFFFIFSFQIAWSLLIFLQSILGGFFIYFYLRNLKLKKLAAIIGGIVFAFSGFSIAWLEWNNVIQTLIWIPLILLAKDKLLLKWSKRWTVILFIAEISSFFAGHLQVWFYAFCVTNIYLFLKVYQKTKLEKAKNFVTNYLKIYLPFFLVGLTVFIITSVQWIPTLRFILLSGRSLDQSFLQAGWFLPYQNLIQFIAPDFFGNPTTLNYWGIWNYAEFIGYIGILPLIFVLFALFARHDKRTYFWGVICLIAFLLALPTPIAQIPYILRIPLLSTSQPTRLMGIIDLSLSILSALGVDYFLKQKSKIVLVSLGISGAIYASLWIVVLKLYPFLGINLENIHTAKQNLILPTLIFLISSAVIALFAMFRNEKKITLLFGSTILIFIVFDLFRFGWKFTPFTPKNYLYPSTKSISFLEQNIGNYRFMTTDSRILAPNISDIYRLQSIEGYDPLYLQNYGEFIAAMQRNKPDISTPFGFNRIITPHYYQNQLINLLGAKYILTFDEINSKGYKKVFQENLTKIYENKNVFPRAFFVRQIISSKSKQDAINKVFDNINNLNSISVVQGASSQIMSNGATIIKDYKSNFVSVLTTNSKSGFLVLTDVYYPTWHAYIDSKETKIYSTDYVFRGIFVPLGKHIVEFRNRLF